MASQLARSSFQTIYSNLSRRVPLERTIFQSLASPLPTPDFNGRRCNSSMVAEFKKATTGPNKRPLILTSESDPANHTARHEGFFYTVSAEDYDRWFGRGQSPHFPKAIKAFNEACVMVRAPATEVIQCLKSMNYSFPVTRYVFYGRHGCGRSMSLAHVMHFCGSQKWVVLHVPWAPMYNRYFRDTQNSSYQPGRIDQPLEAAEWLAYFRASNDHLLKEFQIATTAQYTWSKREITEVGTPLPELIEFGLQRVKYACDVMGVVLKELRNQASEGKFKVLVAIDGVNAFWSTTFARQEDHRLPNYMAQDLTIVQNWTRLLRNDWTNGAVVCTVNGNATNPPDMQSYLPLELLGKEGFESLDPFVPVNVPAYSDREIYSCIEYYIDRKWIQDPTAGTEEGRKELVALSNRNPYELFKLAVHW